MCNSLELQDLNLFLLLYADDTVIFSESVAGLQKMLDTLNLYADKWKLEVNVSKTKMVVFRNGGKIKYYEKCFYNDVELDIVDVFTYLGVDFKFNGKFDCTQNSIATKARKCTFNLFKKVKDNNLNVETTLSLFDTYVSSVLHYGCEVWGFHKAPHVEKVHVEFLKRIMFLRKSTNNVMVYFELGRCPMYIQRKLRILKYWCSLLKTDNCILQACYKQLFCEYEKQQGNCTNWASKVRNELYSLGLGHFWEQQEVCDVKHFSFLVEQRLTDAFIQSCFSVFEKSSKCIVYKEIVDKFCLQKYLKKRLSNLEKSVLCKYRICAHSLNVEKGRYKNLPRNERKCSFCNMGEMEDEFHFVLVCPAFLDIREKYIKPYYYRKPSFFKFVQLFSKDNFKSTHKLCQYLVKATHRREQFIY